MISGVVNSARAATIPLVIFDVAGAVHPFEPTIDTGYDGFLTLHPIQIAALGLGWCDRVQATLADGTVQYCDVYKATVLWDGVPRSVEVDAIARNPLVGMKLLEGCEVRIKVVDGGFVNIFTPP